VFYSLNFFLDICDAGGKSRSFFINQRQGEIQPDVRNEQLSKITTDMKEWTKITFVLNGSKPQ